MKSKNLLIFSTLSLSLSFFICYLYIAYFNRFASDDYYFFAMCNEKGLIESVKYFYFHWEGAYFGFLYNFGIAKFMSHFQTPFLYNVFVSFTVFGFLYIFYYLFLKKLTSINNKLISLLLAVISISSLYYNDLAIAEVWYWMIGGIYAFFPSAFILFFMLFISTKNYFLLGLCYILFFVFASVRLNYSIIFLAILIIYMIAVYYKNKIIDKKTFFAIIIFSIALLTYLFAPGNFVRHDLFKSKVSFDLIDIIRNTFEMVISYFKEYVLLKLHYHILFLLPTIYIGFLLKDSLIKIVSNRKKMLKLYAILFLCFIFLLVLQCIIMYLAKGGQTKRTLPMINLLFLIYCMVILLYIGAFYVKKWMAEVLLIIGIFGSSTLLWRRLYANKNIVIEYSLASDYRHYMIKNALDNYNRIPIDTLYLSKLPNSGWLHSGEIGKYPNGDLMNNNYLKYYYKTKFVIDLDTINNIK